MNKKAAFAYLDSEFAEALHNQWSGFLTDIGYFNLTYISELLMDFKSVDNDDADEWAYEWASQPKYSEYLETL